MNARVMIITIHPPETMLGRVEIRKLCSNGRATTDVRAVKIARVTVESNDELHDET